MAEKNNTYNFNNYTDNSKQSVSYCRGVWNENFICIAAEENVFAFLNCYGVKKLTEFVVEDEIPEFVEWWGSLSTEKPASVIVHMNRPDDGIRLVRVTGYAAKDCKGGAELVLVDVFKAAEMYPRMNDECCKLAAYLDHFEGVEFEYSRESHSISLFRYNAGERVACESEEYRLLLPELTDRFDKLVGNPDSVHESITYNGQDYSVDSVTLFKDYSLQKIFGRIRRNRERMAVDDVAGISADKLDSFTSLWNKVSALEYAREKIETAGDKHQVILAMIDLDYFKMVNDTYGHAFGDTVISRMALILKRAVSGRGIAARFGGDEFMLVLEDVGSEEALRSILESIRTQLSWAFNSVPDCKISCTVGVAEYPRNGSTFETIFAKTDRALYIGKQKGRNRYIIYKEHLHGELPADSGLTLERGIRESLKVDKMLKGVSWCINQLCMGGTAAVNAVCERLIGLFSVERISIYRGPKLELFETFGKNKPLPDMNMIKDRRFISLFDDDGFYHINLNNSTDKEFEDFYAPLRQNGISETGMFLIGSKRSVRGVFCFDRINVDKANSKKWSDEEVHFIELVTGLMGNLLG